MGERIKVPIPVFAADHTGFDAYMKEVRAWRRLCGLPKADQGVMLWMQLPREHASDIKAKIEAEIGFDDLEKEDGVDKFVKAMEDTFRQTEELHVFEVYRDFFKEMKRKEKETITEFLVRFDKSANQARKLEMDLPPLAKGLKLLDDAGLPESQKMLVMSEIDFKTKENVYKQAKAGLAKYSTEMTSLVKDTAGIKLEAALSVEEEEVLLARGWSKPGRGRGGNNKRRNSGGSKTSGAKSGDGGKKDEWKDIKKKVNPKDGDSEFRICPSCGSFRHLLPECPDSYENLSKSKDYAAAVAAEEVSEEEAYFTNDLTGNLRNMEKESEVEDIILYTNSKKKIDGLGRETLGMCLLDCGCTKNVMGEVW